MSSSKGANRNKSPILRDDIYATAYNIITTPPTPDGDVTIPSDSVATPSDIIILSYVITRNSNISTSIDFINITNIEWNIKIVDEIYELTKKIYRFTEFNNFVTNNYIYCESIELLNTFDGLQFHSNINIETLTLISDTDAEYEDLSLYYCPYVDNIPVSDSIDHSSYTDDNLGSGSVNEIPSRRSDMRFIIRVASYERENLLFYYYFDINDNLVPSYMWSDRIWKRFYRRKLININLVNIHNFCNICYTLKVHDACIICPTANYLR